MSNKIGKVKFFDGEQGIIVTEDTKVLLLEENLVDKDIKEGDIVFFRNEVINNVDKAFFVRKYDN